MYYGFACTHLAMHMLILMLWYIRMNVITYGVDYKALKYKHERDFGWVDFRALTDEDECDYPLC